MPLTAPGGNRTAGVASRGAETESGRERRSGAAARPRRRAVHVPGITRGRGIEPEGEFVLGHFAKDDRTASRNLRTAVESAFGT